MASNTKKSADNLKLEKYDQWDNNNLKIQNGGGKQKVGRKSFFDVTPKEREKLKSLLGKEGHFEMTVQQFRKRKEGKRNYVKTIAVENVTDDKKEFITDHLWMDECPELTKLLLHKYDVFECDASVIEYIKTPYETGGLDRELNYALDNIKNAVKISSTQADRNISPTKDTIVIDISDYSAREEYVEVKWKYDELKNKIVFSKNKTKVVVKLEDLKYIIKRIEDKQARRSRAKSNFE